MGPSRKRRPHCVRNGLLGRESNGLVALCSIALHVSYHSAGSRGTLSPTGRSGPRCFQRREHLKRSLILTLSGLKEFISLESPSANPFLCTSLNCPRRYARSVAWPSTVSSSVLRRVRYVNRFEIRLFQCVIDRHIRQFVLRDVLLSQRRDYMKILL